VVQTVNNLVCGDAYLIDGQSNALATGHGEKSPPETTSGSAVTAAGGQSKSARQNLWCYPVWKAEKGEKAELGWWGMELAKRLLESQKMRSSSSMRPSAARESTSTSGTRQSH